MSYYSNSGATIHSGAAGLGGPLKAYRDGSLGALQAYQDGSLGALQAFKDGSLGDLQAFKDGSLGTEDGPMMSFQDGSLGGALFIETSKGRENVEGPVVITHGIQQPMMGTGEYFAPNGMGEYFAPNGMGEYFAPNGVGASPGCGCSAMGAADATKLDLNDGDTVRQLKAAMGMVPFMLPYTFGDKAVPQFNEAFFKSGAWDDLAIAFTMLFVQGYANAGPNNAAAASTFADASGKCVSADMVATVLALLGYKQPVQASFDFKLIPTLTAFYDAKFAGQPVSVVCATGGGFGGMKASTLALVGVGVLAVGFMLLRKKK